MLQPTNSALCGLGYALDKFQTWIQSFLIALHYLRFIGQILRNALNYV